MITNPKVGQRVKIQLPYPSSLNNRVGTIVRGNPRSILIRMDNDGANGGGLFYALHGDQLDHLELTPQEQDQQRRQEHADKYL